MNNIFTVFKFYYLQHEWKVPQSIETIHEYRASLYLEQTVSASHRSWRSWKAFPNEVHQRAKS
jgi:hypothetical protein